MAVRSDHKALVFLGAVAVLGASVRAVRAAGEHPAAAQPALARQAQAADSSARAQQTGRGRGKGRKRTDRARGRADSTSGGRDGQTEAGQPAQGAADRPGYFHGRLDLDVATASQIDALPGVSPTMARRIVLDRIRRGPFVTRDGFKRVPGVGPLFLSRIDSLIAFSGTVAWPNPSDTAILRANRRKRRK